MTYRENMPPTLRTLYRAAMRDMGADPSTEWALWWRPVREGETVPFAAPILSRTSPGTEWQAVQGLGYIPGMTIDQFTARAMDRMGSLPILNPR